MTGPLPFVEKAFKGYQQESCAFLMFVIEFGNEENYLAQEQATACSILPLRKTFL
jgi:hypothetical protein